MTKFRGDSDKRKVIEPSGTENTKASPFFFWVMEKTSVSKGRIDFFFDPFSNYVGQRKRGEDGFLVLPLDYKYVVYQLEMMKPFFLILILFVCSVSANESTFPVLKKTTSVYEFPDGDTMTVTAFGHVYKDDREEALILDELEVKLGEKLIDPEGFRKIAAQFRGIKLETIELIKEIEYTGDFNKVEWVFILRFDFNAYAFDAVSSPKREYWKRASVFFNPNKVKTIKVNDRASAISRSD